MQYKASISWARGSQAFDPKSFDRSHQIQFGNNLSIQASSAPEFSGRADLPNPEELFIASIASCYMLTFLYYAAVEGLGVDLYTTEAAGTLAKNSEGQMAVTEVIIKPQITFKDNAAPESFLFERLIKKAHDYCFITSSVKTKVKIESQQFSIS